MSANLSHGQITSSQDEFVAHRFCTFLSAQRFIHTHAVVVSALVLLCSNRANALVIDPIFDPSITSSSNASEIEGAIDSAINTIDGLYSNVVTVPVTFTYDPAASGNLLSTTQTYYAVPYSTYVSLLNADSVANPQNTVLTTALAYLSKGNNANGAAPMAVAGNQLNMLRGTAASPANAVININSIQPFDFSQPASSNGFDAIGGIEHELDEVLGGGGAGSTLNACSEGNSFFCGKYGPLDLYRYSAPSTPSDSITAASSYFSIDGGVTDIVDFNQTSEGDFADFAPNCGGGSPSGPGQLIQNAFNCMGPDEPYTSLSPEFTMEEAIGWDSAVTPTPAALPLFAAGLGALGLLGWLSKRKVRVSLLGAA